MSSRFFVIFLLATLGATVFLPGSSSCQSRDEIATLTGQMSQFKMEGRYQEAIPAAERLLVINEGLFGSDHPNTARAAVNLANFYRMTGRYGEAEPLFRRALAIEERAPRGPNRLSVAFTLQFLAMLYNNTGRYADAEPLIRRALEIRQRARMQSPESVAYLLTLLAEAYHFSGRQAEAEPVMKQAVEIWEKHQNHPPDGMSFALTTIARIYRNTARYAEAESLIKRSLEICEKGLGENHPNVAFGLTNLAMIYRITGRQSELEPLYKRALAIWEKSLGERHPTVSVSLNNLGLYYAVTGRHSEARTLLKRSADIRDSVRESIFTLLTEKQKLSYMKTQEWGIYGYLSHSLLFPDAKGTAVTDAFNAWLKWKGSVVEAQGRYLDALHTSENPNVQKKLKELTDVKREIARLQLFGPGKTPPDDYKRRMSEYEIRKESLEAEIMASSRDFMLTKKARAVDVKTLSSLLPADTVYLDYAKITLFDFEKRKFGEPHYLLFVLARGDRDVVKLIDLGGSRKVDSHVKAYLSEMDKAKTEEALPDEKKLKSEASILYDILIKPVEPFLTGKKSLLVSPDGNLNLIPFDALVAPTGAYLIEGSLISYVGAGRDMVKFEKFSLRGGASLIIADPDYDLGQKEIEDAKSSAGIGAARVRGRVSRDAGGMRFDRLPDTKVEADTIARILQDKFGQKVSNRQDKRALEYVLFSMKSPRVLHLATHGYFLTEEETRQPDRMSEMSDDPLQEIPVTIENPMLRSGIVLAGANTSLREGKDEGMVTAEKIVGLDLKGTDIVILSACQTGVGDIQSGEGVFGLKRAFILSGAKTLVMSLWSVPSEETVDLMTSFYRLISEGHAPSEALRQAKLGIMKNKPHPFFWAAFVITGSP